jgi:methyltransferase (TIGR00027 family)
MGQDNSPITHVMDTAFWVASYRTEETHRPDALFKDPLAAKLTGELGSQIAKKMFGSKYVRWGVVIRTVIIDRWIQELVASGVDTIINLGAGLDTRPYRMNLPANLKWIEVDFEKTIQMKNQTLANETPKVNLQRISLDLSNRAEKQKLFAQISSQSQKVLILTEGVVPYLTESQVAELAEDLRAQKNFKYWIAEYLSPKMYSYFKSKRRQKMMRNAPFQFMPADWYGFFDRYGWKAKDTKYMAEESIKLKRPIPLPWIAVIFRPFIKNNTEMYKRFSGFILFEPK